MTGGVVREGAQEHEVAVHARQRREQLLEREQRPAPHDGQREHQPHFLLHHGLGEEVVSVDWGGCSSCAIQRSIVEGGLIWTPIGT